MREGEIQAAILGALAKHPRVAAWRQNTGAARIGNRFVRFGLKGAADICGVIAPTGRALFVEVKAQRGTQSPEQRAFERMVTARGALYVLARDVDTVLDAIGDPF
jgi:hypothetical protein